MSSVHSFSTGARMRGVVSLLLAAILLAACADSGLPPVTDQIRARFPPGGVVDVIEVDAIDRLPLRKAELVAPDGQTTPASRSDEHTSELQSRGHLVCRLLLEKKN